VQVRLIDKLASTFRRVRRQLLEIGLVVLLFFGIGAWQKRHLLASDVPAPAFRLSALDGREVSLDDLRGKAVLLHFWATWCGVCKMEQAGLNALERQLPSNTTLITVVADADDRSRIKRYVQEHGIHYPVLLADEQTLARFRVSAFPTNYYLDDGGKIRQATVGMSSRVSMWIRLWLVS
jgi:thiol-disulfide isomerase/thioredoxin